MSKSLELQAEATSPVSITTTKAMNVADDDQTIIVPAMSQDVTINLASITESASDDYLYLSDNGNGYNKTFTLNVKGTTANTLKIWLDMPDATVVIASENVNAIAEVKGEAKSIVIGTTNDTDKTNVTAVSPDEGSSEVIINGEAGGLTILNNSNTTTVNINGKLNTTFDATTYSDETDANKYITVTLGDKAIVTGDLRVKHAITVPGKAQINGTLTSTGDITIAGVAADNKASVTGAVSSPANITVNGTAGAAVTSTTAGTITVGQFGAVTGAITSANGKITINGTASDDVTATKGDVEVTATGSVAKKVTANAGNVIISGTVKDVDVTGNATVSRTTEGEAVSGLIEIKGESRTLTLTGGYINELKASGSADKKRLTVSNTESIQTAIKGLATGSESINFGTSTWAGSKIKVSGSGTTYTGYVNTANIYTASQFAGYEGSAEAKLEANIALGTHAFTPVAAVASGNTFDGNSKTISGGVVTFATAASGDNVGLFKTIAADVKNLTIDGLKITATSSAAGKPLGGVGVLAGKATGGKITNVNVKNAEVSSDQLIVGGLVGEIAGDVTIEGASQGAGKDQFTTVAATITGKNNLGGLVGKVSSGTTTITIYKAAPSFTVTEVNTDDRTTNVNFGTVAPFVGTVASGATLQVAESADDAGYKATNVLSATQRTALGFKHNWVKSGEVYYDFYGRKAVGYCTEATGPTVKIASGNAAKVDDHQTAATADAASVAAAEASATTKELNIYVKE
ncbi:MAG: polymer-forming cytoskeletal protein [Bacteroidaceae bacterium]|nr:polymer-forming cytoskeletal protein [Bacteroidaceae bacterium]